MHPLRLSKPATIVAAAVLSAMLPAASFAATAPASTEGAAAPSIASDTELFFDNFESGLGNWTVTTAGNGTANTTTATTPAGTSQVARITVPDYSSNSIAYLKRTLAEPVYAVSVSGYFNVTSAGCDSSAGYSGGSVPFIRMFDSQGRRVAGLYRINGSCSKTAKVYVQHSGSFFRTGKNIGLDSWAKWELRITVNGGSSLVQVYLDNIKVYEVTGANNGIVPIASVNLHNEHANQVGRLLADDIRIGTFAGSAPTNPCDAATANPSNGDPGTQVLADNFESFNLNKWTGTGIAVDGSAAVVAGNAHSGNCAALLHVTGTTGSRAYLNKALPAGSGTVHLDGWLNVTAEGALGSNVPYWRVFNGSTRLVDVYRQNVNGFLYSRTPNGSGGWTYTNLGKTVALNSWHRVQVSAVASTGTVEIRYDGTLLKTFTNVPFGVGAFTSAQVHSEHFTQKGDILVDDTVIKVVAN